MTLIKRQWKSDRGTLLTWCITVTFLTWMVVAMYRVMASSGAIDYLTEMAQSMPPYVQALIGKGGLDVFGTFIASMEYGGVMFIAFIIFVSVYVPGLITREIDKRSSEFLLALPVTRASIMGVRWLGLVTSLTALTLCQWASLVVAAGAEAQPARYFWASLNVLLVFIEVGGLLLLASVFIDDYSKGAGVSAGVAMFLFFFNSMTESGAGSISVVRKALPFARFDASSVLSSGKIPAVDLLVLAAGCLVLFFLSVKAFDSKQIAG